jgi:hypothetical protein
MHGQGLTGFSRGFQTLDDVFAFCRTSWQAVKDIWLHNNRLSGLLPQQWGLKNSFPDLYSLTIFNNLGLRGTIPDSWGRMASSRSGDILM